MTASTRLLRHSLLGLLCATLAGCGAIDKRLVGGSIPAHGSIVPAKTINLTPGYATTLEKLTVTAAAAGGLYYIYKPLDPNWEVDGTRTGEDTFRLSLRMKRFHTGGEGEAVQVARQFAETLQAAHGASEYVLLSFAQGIDSSTPISRRVASATVRLKNMTNPHPEVEPPPSPVTDAAVEGEPG